LGLLDQARKAVAELTTHECREQTIANVIMPFKREIDRQAYAEGLRRAGMPER
jgi:adenylate cyclase